MQQQCFVAAFLCCSALIIQSTVLPREQAVIAHVEAKLFSCMLYASIHQALFKRLCLWMHQKQLWSRSFNSLKPSFPYIVQSFNSPQGWLCKCMKLEVNWVNQFKFLHFMHCQTGLFSSFRQWTYLPRCFSDTIKLPYILDNQQTQGLQNYF